MYLQCVKPTATLKVDPKYEHTFQVEGKEIPAGTVVYWNGMSWSAAEMGVPEDEAPIFKIVALYNDREFTQVVAYVFEEDLKHNFSEY